MNESPIAPIEKKHMPIWKKVLIILASIIGGISVLSFLFITVLVITDNHKTDDKPKAEITTSIYEQMTSWEEGEDDYKETDLTPISVKMSDEGSAELESEIMSIPVDYDYAQAYNIDEVVAYKEKTEKKTVTKHKHDIRINGKLDADILYNKVKSNNENFIENDLNEAWYNEYKNKDLREYCDMVVDIIDDILKKYPTTDADTVYCYLYDLKILDRVGTTDLAAVEIKKKVLHINENMLESWSKITKNENIQEETIYHEMMHIFQCTCDCWCSEGEDRIGICHSYDCFDMNPLSWNWLAEASAEMNACEMLNMDETMYSGAIGYAKTLNLLLNMGDSSDNAARIQDLYFSRNEDIYKMFDMTTEEEKTEFIKLMYSLEIMQESKSDFYDWYDETYNVELISNEDAEVKMWLTLKEDVLLSLTKMFYRNLTRNINSGNATLQDVYYLLRLYECDLQHHIGDNKVGMLIFFKDLYPEYLELQNLFFDSLAKENNMTADDIKSGFESYSINAKNGDTVKSPNCTLEFLSSPKRDGIISYCNDIYKKGYPSMEEADKLCHEWLVKAPYEDLKLKK